MSAMPRAIAEANCIMKHLARQIDPVVIDRHGKAMCG
jgi:hypothetical protein